VRIERLLDTFRGRPATENAWPALVRSARVLFTGLDDLDPRWLAQLRLVRQHPSLLARQIATQSALEHDLAVAIAARSPGGDGEPLRSRLRAAVFLTTIRTAIAVWSEHPGSASPGDTIEAALREAGQRFT
jgi:hypothetical protein